MIIFPYIMLFHRYRGPVKDYFYKNPEKLGRVGQALHLSTADFAWS